MPVSHLIRENLYTADYYGSSQTISWSRNGFICYATPATRGHNLEMSFLENTDGCNWQLATPYKFVIKASESGSVQNLQLVSWSNVSTDLAIFDEHGNFYILLAGVGLLQSKESKDESQKDHDNNFKSSQASSVGTSGDDGPSYELTSYNHAEVIYRDVVSPVSSAVNGKVCVAFEWLSIDKPQIINKPAKLTDNGNYTYGVHSFQSPLLAHPIATKQACVALRENGTLSIYHQGEHKVEYYKLSIDLNPSGVPGSSLFTLASIGFTTDKKILVCAHDAQTGKIYTFSVTVDWGFLKDSAVKQKADPHYCTPKDKQSPPSLTAVLLHEMHPVPALQVDAISELRNYSRYKLSSIDIISPCYLADSALDVLVSYDVISSDNTISQMVQRFQIKSAGETMGGVFSSMRAPGSTIEDRKANLEFQDRFHFPKKLKAIRTSTSGSVVLFVNDDGSTIAVNRADWSLIVQKNHLEVTQENNGEVSHGSKPEFINTLLDCGFEIPLFETNTTPFLFAISPNLTGVVHLSMGSSELVYTTLRRQVKHNDIRLLSSAFSHTHAHACYSNSSSDDLMALVQAIFEELRDSHQQDRLARATVIEAHSAINFHLNAFSKESVEKLLSNPPLQKLLSLQLTMSDLGRRKVSADVAWVVLNLRSTSFGIMFSLSSIFRQMSKKKPIEDSMEDSINRAECIISLVGSVKWFVDLLIYLNQELLQLSLAKTHTSQSVITFENSISLPIIMSKVPRLFVISAISSISKAQEIFKRLHKDLSESNKLFTPMKEALERFFNAANWSPLKLNTFEGLLRECDDLIQKEVNSKGADNMRLLHYEQQLFCEGTVPKEMLPTAHSIVDRFSAGTTREARLSALYFYDNRWLQIGAAHGGAWSTEDPIPRIKKPTQVRLQLTRTDAIDSLRKVFISCCSPISSGGVTPMGDYFNSVYKLKKCVRCRSVSLISDPLVFDSLKTIGLWTMVFQRNCICGSAWVNCVSEENR